MKIKLFLYVLVISSDKVLSDFNLKDHAFKPITALQCNNGSPEIFSNKKNMCKKIKYETKLEPENVVILQRVEQVQTCVRNLKVQWMSYVVFGVIAK